MVPAGANWNDEDEDDDDDDDDDDEDDDDKGWDSGRDWGRAPAD